jgi:hypothetical protein
LDGARAEKTEAKQKHVKRSKPFEKLLELLHVSDGGCAAAHAQIAGECSEPVHQMSKAPASSGIDNFFVNSQQALFFDALKPFNYFNCFDGTRSLPVRGYEQLRRAARLAPYVGNTAGQQAQPLKHLFKLIFASFYFRCADVFYFGE